MRIHITPCDREIILGKYLYDKRFVLHLIEAAERFSEASLVGINGLLLVGDAVRELLDLKLCRAYLFLRGIYGGGAFLEREIELRERILERLFFAGNDVELDLELRDQEKD